ncbi:glycosyltransferase family 4 protein [Vibrio owensii]|uniref:glycosyltransferase family 4 protein n=1 Tax=Vibrio owensii TaxID=696485 RepID=UPI002F41A176
MALVVSTPSTINSFMVNHIKKLSDFYKITVIANEQLDTIKTDLPVDFIHLPMKRDISPFNDLVCIAKLYGIIRSNKFDAVHTITPKAGLVGMISSFLARVDNRFHTFTGQVWATKSGGFRLLLKSIDKLIFSLSTYSLIDSPSQQQFLLDERVINSGKSSVLGKGSISGVDIVKFTHSKDKRSELRKEHRIPNDAFVFIFLGRLCKDKGIDELMEAFQKVSQTNLNVYLLLVGPNESNYDASYFEKQENERIVVAGPTRYPEHYFSVADVLVLPSYREGFGTTVLEAAASGIPTIASNIYGLSDAVVDKHTGLLHDVRNVESLTSCMFNVINDQELTSELGLNAKSRVNQYFSADYLSNELMDFYKGNVGV